MASSVRIVHAARCRLDVPPAGFGDAHALPGPARAALEDASLDAFDRLVEEARRLEAHAVLLVGDTVRAADRSLRARRRLENGLARLDEADVACVIAPGPLDPAAFYRGVNLPDTAAVLSDRHPRAAVECGRRRVEFVLHDADDRAGDDDGVLTMGVVPPSDEPIDTDPDREGLRRFDPRHDLGRGPGVTYWALGDGAAASADVAEGVAHDPGPLVPTRADADAAGGATLVEIDAGGSVRTRTLECSPVACRTLTLSSSRMKTVEDLAEAMADRLPTARDAELTVLTWRLTGGGELAGKLTPARWREAVELADDRAGRERIHRLKPAAASGEPDEIAAMLSDEFLDRLSQGDLDPRDEAEEVEPGPIQDVLAAAAARPRTAARVTEVGAAVFAAETRPLWDAA